MKVKKIVLALSVALSATSAFAGTDITSGVPTNNIIYIAGGTAQTPGLAAMLVNFCSSTIDTYTDATDGASGFIYKCATANTSTSGLTGAFIVHKLDNGSSGGVSPVVNGTLVTTWPNSTNVNAGATQLATANTHDIVGNYAGTAPMSGLSAAPQIGMTDVSIDIWKARGTTGLPAASTFTRAVVAGQGFGIAVSDKLYKLLQADQGISSAANAYLAQPSISKAQYASLISGKEGVWQALLPNTVANHPANLPTTLKLARRSTGSGTTASGEIFFLGTPCNSLTKLGGALSPTPISGTAYADTTLATVTGAPASTDFWVVDAGSSGAVMDVLANVATLSVNDYSIGVLSLENLQPLDSNATDADWKFVKIDGVSPNYKNDGTLDASQKLNTVNGTYQFQFESEITSKNATVSGNSALAAFRTKMLADLANGNRLTSAPGIYAEPVAAYAGGNLVEGQTNHYSRGGNDCQQLQLSWY